MQADLMLSGANVVSVMNLERRQLLAIPNWGELYVATPQDIGLSKLQWRNLSQSEKHWRDVLDILKAQAELLDLAYLRDWASQLKVVPDLQQALQAVGR